MLITWVGPGARLLLRLSGRLLRHRRSRSPSTCVARLGARAGRPSHAAAPRAARRRSRPDVRAGVHPQRLARRHGDRARLRRWSATSSCCARRCSPATRSATSPSPARSPRPPPGSTRASACSRRRSRSRCCSARSATARSADDVMIGIVFAWILGLGVFFLALFSAGSGGGNGLLGARALFGSIFGLSAADVAARRGRSARGIVVVRARDRPAAAVRERRPGRGGRARRARPRARAAAPRAPRARPPPRRPRRSARCCCSACSPRRPAPRSGSPPTPYLALGAVRRDRRARRCGSGSTLSYRIPKLPPSSAIIARRRRRSTCSRSCATDAPRMLRRARDPRGRELD